MKKSKEEQERIYQERVKEGEERRKRDDKYRAKIKKLTYAETRAEVTRLQAEADEKLKAYHEVDSKIFILKEHKKTVCPHTKVKIRTNSYFEPGKMSHPSEWEEKVCCRCGAVVATLRETVIKKWSDEK